MQGAYASLESTGFTGCGMAGKVEFGLLGPLRVCHDGKMVPISPGRQRALLAALLLGRGQLMPAQDLLDVLWPAGPPRSALASLQNFVCRLRIALGEPGRTRLLTQPGGYLLNAGPAELDVSRFETLLLGARQAVRAGAWEQAAAQAQEALSLWRGEPLADVASEFLPCG